MIAMALALVMVAPVPVTAVTASISPAPSASVPIVLGREDSMTPGGEEQQDMGHGRVPIPAPSEIATLPPDGGRSGTD